MQTVDEIDPSQTSTPMKNATKHADTLRSFAKKTFKQAGDIPELTPLDPLTALVRGTLSQNTSDSRADEAMKIIGVEFVDLNELRVATELELQEIIGSKYPDIETRVSQFVTCLNAIFAREHALNLDRVKTLPRREIRQFFRELPGITPFVEGYVMLFSFGQLNAFPVDDAILEALREGGVVEEDANAEDTQKFVEHHLKDDEGYRLFWCLRHKKKK